MPLTCDEVLRIARLDAEKAYHDVSRFRIMLEKQPDGWHVDYELMNPNLNGGGPHYVIDPATGAIHSKRYEQ
jgi:hypothetical protein